MALRSPGARLFPQFVAALPVWLVLMVTGAGAAPAQEPSTATTDTLVLSLDRSVSLALQDGWSVRLSRLDLAEAEAGLSEAWGSVFPRVTSTTRYTRNEETPSPFTGSSAGALFEGQDPTSWLVFNERARTDDLPGTEALSLPEYQERVGQAFSEQGLTPGGQTISFTVPNQFRTGLSLSQPLLNLGAFSGIRAARTQIDLREAATERSEHMVVDSVRTAYYGALLAARTVEVQERGVERARAAYEEAVEQVGEGVRPLYHRLSARVEMTNRESALTEAIDASALARDGLKLALGVSPDVPVSLTDSLDVGSMPIPDLPLDTLQALALGHRPDVEQARLGVEGQEARREAIRGQLWPRVSAFAEVAYVGSVPDDRTRVRTDFDDPETPFQVEQTSRGVFADRWWNPSLSWGLLVSWSPFDGGRIRARADQAAAAAESARVRLDQARSAAALGVEGALRSLAAARDRVLAQRENVDVAERSHEMIRERVRVGVSTPLERREASRQLDQARLGLARAKHDYLVARSALLVAVGRPLGDLGELVP